MMRRPVIYNKTLDMQINVLTKTEAEAERDRLTYTHGHPFYIRGFTGTPWYTVGAVRRRDKLDACTYVIKGMA